MVQVKNLCKRYGAVQALKEVSFEARAGHILGLLGPNGAGKTTTMNIIAGYISATEGGVIINGADLFEQPLEAKSQLGYLPEQPPLYLDMTVEGYLGFVWELKNCKLQKSEHILEICKKTGIKGVQKRLIKNLSKGYRQRVGLAQALIGYPPVLLLDEPTSGLDPVQIIEIRELIKGLGKSHTIILSSHILPEVQMLCDRILVLDKGSIIADGAPDELSKNLAAVETVLVRIKGPCKEILCAVKKLNGAEQVSLLPQAESGAFDFCLSCTEDLRAALFDLTAKKGWQLLELKTAPTTLEDTFLRLMTKEAISGEVCADEGHF